MKQDQDSDPLKDLAKVLTALLTLFAFAVAVVVVVVIFIWIVLQGIHLIEGAS